MTFAQLTYRESPRDIEACLRAQSIKLYHKDIRGGILRSTLAKANKVRDWRMPTSPKPQSRSRRLYVKEGFRVDLSNTPYALDASTIDPSLSLFPWAR